MFTAKITNKEKVNGILAITVQFSDGVDTYTEVVKPQDEAGFKHWVKARLSSFETSKALEEANNLNKEVELDTTVPLTQAELAQEAWIKNYRTLVDVQRLIDLGVLTGGEPKIVALREKVKQDFKPTYLGIT